MKGDKQHCYICHVEVVDTPEWKVGHIAFHQEQATRPEINADTIVKTEEAPQLQKETPPPAVTNAVEPKKEIKDKLIIESEKYVVEDMGSSKPPQLLNNAEKWKTAEERILACEAYCKYLERGRSKMYYPEADENTIQRYIKKYPAEFRAEKIADAERRGLAYIESLGFQGVTGRIPGFNPTTWIFITKNKLGWRDKQDITTNDDKISTVHVYKPQRNEE